MTQVGRNDPCPCGSGKKHKRCCLQKDETLAHERFTQEKAARVAAEAAARRERQELRVELAALASSAADEDTLTEDSNAIIDLVEAGKLDEAERAARDFLAHYPEVHDGFDRLGMVYEARGDRHQAAHWYRQCLDFVRTHRELYEPAVEERYERLIAKMEATPDAAP
jgi:hypothetical protein